MDQAILQQAQAWISTKTPNATCPMCGGTRWNPLQSGSFMAVAIKVAIDSAPAKEILDGFGEDISVLEMLRCEAIGFLSANCRYLRLHG